MSVALWERPKDFLMYLGRLAFLTSYYCVARLLSLALITAFTGLLWRHRGRHQTWTQFTRLEGAECPGLCHGAGNARLLLGSETGCIEWVLLCARHLQMTRSSHCSNRIACHEYMASLHTDTSGPRCAEILAEPDSCSYQA